MVSLLAHIMDSPIPFWVYIAFLLVTSPFVLTWLATSLQFRRDISRSQQNSKAQKNGKYPPPVVPYRVPFLGDAITMFIDPYKYVSGVCSRYGWRQPLRVKIGPTFPTFITNPVYITEIFKNPKLADEKPGQSARLQRMFRTSVEASKFWDVDDSGVGVQPRKGSNVKPEHRVHFWGVKTPKTFLAGQHLVALNTQFTAILRRQLDKQGIQERWVELPDLYVFIQSAMGRALTESVMGPKLLEVNPNLMEDFYSYDNNLMQLMFGLPRWISSSAYDIRDRLRDAIKKWHSETQKEAPLDAENPGIAPQDPEIDPLYGSKLIKAQRAAVLKMGLDAGDMASVDLSLLFALNSNVLRTGFWMAFHAIRDASLRDSLLEEAKQCQGTDGTFDVAALVQKPRLQSAFAELCRYYVAIALPRVVSYSDLKIGGHIIPEGQTVVMFNREPGFNDEAWAAVGRPQQTPLAEFDPERFLVKQDPSDASAAASATQDDAGLVFSLDKLGGCWVPFGGGQRTCPGRHFAKAEILAAFSVIFSSYELEFVSNTDNVKADMRWYPIGTVLPTRKVPFRIRKRTASQS